MTPKVMIILGSGSDIAIAEKSMKILEKLEIPYSLKIASAHRTPDLVRELVVQGTNAGIKVFIGIAGLAAHLPGAIAAYTHKPVIGVPVNVNVDGLDALYSSVQMPYPSPVATVGIDRGDNGAILAAQILGLYDEEIRKKVLELKEEYKQNMNKYGQELSDFKKNYNWIVRQYQERGAALEQQRQYLVKRRKEAAELSKDLYDINIIPSRFRNIYPIAYLYDYFSTSREDDLDKIIQTMLLEKIIEQLKSVIGKMNEALENQREQIALLSESNEIAERSRMDNINHLLAIERNQEKREDYERMTVANSLVTNFILADMQRQVSDIQYRL